MRHGRPGNLLEERARRPLASDEGEHVKTGGAWYGGSTLRRLVGWAIASIQCTGPSMERCWSANLAWEVPKAGSHLSAIHLLNAGRALFS